MSLETVIQENTAALRDLITRLNSGALPTMSAAEYVKTIDAPTTVVEAAGIEPKVELKEVKQSAELDKAVEKIEEAAKVEQTAIDYTKDVKPLLLKVSTSKGRDALVGLLAKFGVDKGDKLPADKLRNVIAEVETLLAA